MLFVRHPKILHKHCFRFLLEVKVTPRKTENNAYAKFWGDEQRALWYVMVFSVVVNCRCDLFSGVERFHSRDQHPQIYENKRKRLHKKRDQLPQDWFGWNTNMVAVTSCENAL